MTDVHTSYESMETRLHARKTEYDTIPVPNVAASLAIQTGINQATRKHKTRLRWVMSSISLAAFILLFTGCIWVSPAFASLVKQIPGMESIVNIIRQDKGLMMAIDQSLLQKVGISNEHDGVAITVEGIITDESRMVIFYKIKGMKNPERANFDIELLDGDGKKLPVGLSYSSPDSTSDHQVYEDFIDVIFTKEASPPDKLNIVFKSRNKAQPGVWNVVTQVDKSLTEGMKKIMNINQSITLDGQHIAVKQATLYPTRLVLDIQIDSNNTKKIFGLTDLQLVDEQGRVWRTNTSSGEDTRSIYFESMYFSTPQKLTLQGSGFSGLDKKELDFSLNLESKKITGGPSGFKMLSSQIEGKDLIVDFFIPLKMENSFILAFSKVKDSSGNSYEVTGSSWNHSSETDENHTVVSSTIENGAKLKGEIQLQIATYPTKVYTPFSLEIPMNP